MDKLIYQRGEDSKEPKKVSFDVSPDLTIQEFKRTCKRLAYSLGYSPESIDREFGKDKEVGDVKQLKLLFD